jgi:hypothetical protein
MEYAVITNPAFEVGRELCRKQKPGQKFKEESLISSLKPADTQQFIHLLEFFFYTLYPAHILNCFRV